MSLSFFFVFNLHTSGLSTRPKEKEARNRKQGSQEAGRTKQEARMRCSLCRKKIALAQWEGVARCWAAPDCAERTCAACTVAHETACAAVGLKKDAQRAALTKASTAQEGQRCKSSGHEAPDNAAC